MGLNDTLMEMGLVKACSEITITEHEGTIFRDYCGTPTLFYGGKCSKHSESLELARQAKAEVAKNAAIHRALLEDEILPKAHKRVMDILNNEDSKDADIIKIWQTTMDRVGLAAVTGLIVEGNVTVDAPLDILRRMLSQNQPTLEDMDTVDGEILDEDSQE